MNVAVCAFVFAITQSGPVGAADGKPIVFLTERPLQAALDRPLTATWQNIDLRTIAHRLQETQRVAILIDRRVDPSRERTVSINNAPLREAFGKLVDEVETDSVVTGNVAFIGPKAAVAALPTLIEMRNRELFTDKTNGISKTRQIALSRRATVTWDDLESPVKLIERVTKQHQLSVDGIDRVPHDLWASGTMPNATAIEALSMTLIQFDLTFRWKPAAIGISIVPLPPPNELSAATPNSPGTSTGTTTTGVNKTTGSGSTKTTRPATPDPLRDTRFTLKVDAPVSALIKNLAGQPNLKLQFDYDPDALKAAGVDLSQFVKVDVKQATLDQLLESIFKPAGIQFERMVHKITLTPRRSS